MGCSSNLPKLFLSRGSSWYLLVHVHSQTGRCPELGPCQSLYTWVQTLSQAGICEESVQSLYSSLISRISLLNVWFDFHLGLKYQASRHRGSASSVPTHCVTAPLDICFLPSSVTHSALSISKAADSHSQPCPGGTIAPFLLERKDGEMRAAPGKGTTHPLVSPEVQKFFIDKHFSIDVPLPNFQSPEMVVFDNFVQFYICVFDGRVCELFVLPSP